MDTIYNKGNYSLDTCLREKEFNRNRGFGCEKEYLENRRQWEEYPQKCIIGEYPLLVDLELSTACNLKCPFCYTITEKFKKKVKKQLMDFDLFKKIIDEISGKVFAIRLSLRGESTLHPNFIDATKYAKDRGIREVSTLTNLSLMTPDYFEKCLIAGIDWITVSFDGLYSEYEKNRFPLKFNESYFKLEEIKKIKLKHRSVKPVIKVQTVWPAIQEVSGEFLRKMQEVSDLVAFNPLIDFNNNNQTAKFEEGFSCPQLYQRLVVGADGIVMMCANDEENEYPIGDANVSTVHELWHSKKLNSAREYHKIIDGFKKINICRKCYLPRKTEDEVFKVDGKDVIVKQYI